MTQGVAAHAGFVIAYGAGPAQHFKRDRCFSRSPGHIIQDIFQVAGSAFKQSLLGLVLILILLKCRHPIGGQFEFAFFVTVARVIVADKDRAILRIRCVYVPRLDLDAFALFDSGLQE